MEFVDYDQKNEVYTVRLRLKEVMALQSMDTGNSVEAGIKLDAQDLPAPGLLEDHDSESSVSDEGVTPCPTCKGFDSFGTCTTCEGTGVITT